MNESILARLAAIESAILADPLFKTLSLHPQTRPFSFLRAQQIIKAVASDRREQQLTDLKAKLAEYQNGVETDILTLKELATSSDLNSREFERQMLILQKENKLLEAQNNTLKGENKAMLRQNNHLIEVSDEQKSAQRKLEAQLQEIERNRASQQQQHAEALAGLRYKIQALESAREAAEAKIARIKEQNTEQSNRQVKQLKGQIGSMEIQLTNSETKVKDLQETINVQAKKFELRLDSSEREKEMLQAQLELEKDKLRVMQAQLDTKLQVEQWNKQLLYELESYKEQIKSIVFKSEEMAITAQTQRNNLLQELTDKDKEIEKLGNVVAELQQLARQQRKEIQHKVQRESEHKRHKDRYSDRVLELEEQNNKLESHTRVLQAKLTEVSTKAASLQSRNSQIVKELATQQKNFSSLQNRHSRSIKSAKDFIGSVKSELKMLRSELKQLKRTSCTEIRDAQTYLGQLIQTYSRNLQGHFEVANSILVEQLSDVQKSLKNTARQHRKEVQALEKELEQRDNLIKKSQFELMSERKSNLVLRETLNSQSKESIRKKLDFDREMHVVKERLRNQEIFNNQRLSILQRRYQDALRDSNEKYREVEKKVQLLSGKKSMLGSSVRY